MAKRKKKIEEKKEDFNKETSKKRKEEENKILKTVLIGIGIAIIALLLIVVVYSSIKNFEYHGLQFEVVKFCDSGPPCLVTYKTSLPVKVEGKNVIVSEPSEKTDDYDFYLRNDPREPDVDFDGTINLRKIMVFNSTENFICDGKGGIAGANLVRLYNVLGVQVIKDENATCDSLDRYMFVNLRPGNQTSIEQVGPACYDIYIKNCEILEGTERFMIETFLKVNEILGNQSS